MKVAIYGGSFDPIHVEHKNIIKACKEELGVEKVILLPTYLPPHKKKSKAPYQDRVNMIKLMTKDLDYVDINDYEFKSIEEVNYAYIMLKNLRKEYEDFVYVIGGDSFRDIEKWFEWENLLRENEIAVVLRNNVFMDYKAKAQEYKEKYGAKITIMDYIGKDISSSMITAANYLYLDITPYVGQDVSNYIKTHNLYRECDKLIQNVKNNVSPRLFQHIVNTTIYGMHIQQYCNINISSTRVFFACFLHDIAKERSDVKYGVPPMSVHTPVFHQFYGERVAFYEYGIDDPIVLDAIRFHTTAKPNMSELGKLVYLADKICEGRTYDGVQDIRRDLMENGLDSAFIKCLNWSYDYIVNKGKSVYPLTKEAIDYYNNKENV